MEVKVANSDFSNVELIRALDLLGVDFSEGDFNIFTDIGDKIQARNDRRLNWKSYKKDNKQRSKDIKSGLSEIEAEKAGIQSKIPYLKLNKEDRGKFNKYLDDRTSSKNIDRTDAQSFHPIPRRLSKYALASSIALSAAKGINSPAFKDIAKNYSKMSGNPIEKSMGAIAKTGVDYLNKATEDPEEFKKDYENKKSESEKLNDVLNTSQKVADTVRTFTSPIGFAKTVSDLTGTTGYIKSSIGKGVKNGLSQALEIAENEGGNIANNVISTVKESVKNSDTGKLVSKLTDSAKESAKELKDTYWKGNVRDSLDQNSDGKIDSSDISTAIDKFKNTNTYKALDIDGSGKLDKNDIKVASDKYKESDSAKELNNLYSNVTNRLNNVKILSKTNK